MGYKHQLEVFPVLKSLRQVCIFNVYNRMLRDGNLMNTKLTVFSHLLTNLFFQFNFNIQRDSDSDFLSFDQNFHLVYFH